MLSNPIWIMPAATRSNAPGTATIFYRCGSQQGKPARSVAADIDVSAFTEATAEFIIEQVAVFQKAQSSKQKNAARNLKKYFDEREIAIIEALGEPLTTDQAIAKFL